MLRIRNVYPGSRRTTTTKGGKNLLSYLFCCHNFTQKFSHLTKNYNTFYPKIIPKLSEIWVGDMGSEIPKKHIPNPGSRGQKRTGFRIRIRNTASMNLKNSKCLGELASNTKKTWDQRLVILSLYKKDRSFLGCTNTTDITRASRRIPPGLWRRIRRGNWRDGSWCHRWRRSRRPPSRQTALRILQQFYSISITQRSLEADIK